MLERLLELVLQAKSGVLASVLLIGTTGALVTATVQTQNGVTTITLTQASPTPSASPASSPLTQNTTHITFNTQLSSNTSDEQPNPCSVAAHEMNQAVRDINHAFEEDHTALEKMRKDARTDAARDLLAAADKKLKEDRQSAVKKLHEEFACAKDDEDKDEHEDEDKDDDGDEHGTTPPSTTVTSTNVTVASTDPKAIADEAIAAMKLVVDTAKADLAKLPAATPKPTHTPRPDRNLNVRPAQTPRTDREGHDRD